MDGLLQPVWLNNSLLTKIIQSLETTTPDIEVLEWTCKHAVPPGSNYLSLLYRVGVKYQTGQDHKINSVNIIMKTPLESGLAKEFVELTNGYEKEVKMYRDVLPSMYELDNSILTARSFDCPLPNSLALEDLTQQGYKMGDRLKQLDPAHCRKSLTTLARFHALSVSLQQKCPDKIKDFKKDQNPDILKKQDVFIKFGLRAMLKTIEELEGCEKYVEIISNKLDYFTETVRKNYQKTYGLQVLCHGDAWSNNILFKYDGHGEVVDSKLVDFQMSFISSFAIDIFYFWWTSANMNTRENHKEEMFEVYRKELNHTLENLGSAERLSKEEFNNVMAFYAPFSLEVISGLLTVVMADPENLADLNDFNDEEMKNLPNEDSVATTNYCSRYYKAVLPNILRQADECGAFLQL